MPAKDQKHLDDPRSRRLQTKAQETSLEYLLPGSNGTQTLPHTAPTPKYPALTITIYLLYPEETRSSHYNFYFLSLELIHLLYPILTRVQNGQLSSFGSNLCPWIHTNWRQTFQPLLQMSVLEETEGPSAPSWALVSLWKPQTAIPQERNTPSARLPGQASGSDELQFELPLKKNFFFNLLIWLCEVLASAHGIFTMSCRIFRCNAQTV